MRQGFPELVDGIQLQEYRKARVCGMTSGFERSIQQMRADHSHALRLNYLPP